MCGCGGNSDNHHQSSPKGCCGKKKKCFECPKRTKCETLEIRCKCVQKCRKVRAAFYAQQCCPCDGQRWVRFEADVIQPYKELHCTAVSVKPKKHHGKPSGCGCGCGA